jgi:hypothetical protein
MGNRQLILGVIFVVWGGAIALKTLVEGIPLPTTGAYSVGSFIAFIFSFAMILVGARAIRNAR